MEQSNTRTHYAHIIIKLLQGPIYVEEKASWRDLQAWKTSILEYISKIGLELILNEIDGFAYLIQPDADEHDENPLPRLMRKQNLSYETTLLCIILREMLEEFDILKEGNTLFLTQKEVKERIELFYKEQANKSKLWRELARPINNLQTIGILKLNREDPLNKDNNQYEVKRIIKALINNEKLEEIKQKLASYVNTVHE